MMRLFDLIDSLPFMHVRVVRYLCAGSAAAVVNLGVLFLLTEYVGWWYLLSSVISTCCAIVVSFTLQKFWTFRNMPLNRVHVQLPLHIALSVLNIIFNAAILYTLVEFFHVWYLFAQLVSGALLACLNYFVMRTFIFHDSQ